MAVYDINRIAASVFGVRVCEEHWSENPWIPALAGMTSTAFLPSFRGACPREGGERESIRPIRTRMRIAVPGAPREEPGLRARTSELRVSLG